MVNTVTSAEPTNKAAYRFNSHQSNESGSSASKTSSSTEYFFPPISPITTEINQTHTSYKHKNDDKIIKCLKKLIQHSQHTTSNRPEQNNNSFKEEVKRLATEFSGGSHGTNSCEIKVRITRSLFFLAYGLFCISNRTLPSNANNIIVFMLNNYGIRMKEQLLTSGAKTYFKEIHNYFTKQSGAGEHKPDIYIGNHDMKHITKQITAALDLQEKRHILEEHSTYNLNPDLKIDDFSLFIRGHVGADMLEINKDFINDFTNKFYQGYQKSQLEIINHCLINLFSLDLPIRGISLDSITLNKDEFNSVASCIIDLINTKREYKIVNVVFHEASFDLTDDANLNNKINSAHPIAPITFQYGTNALRLGIKEIIKG